ncbi:DUF5723 family protein [Leeuwenhoekiella nanhaiensis]|uniref:DUF5723 domain-containing protein n=1 Tax=Leeuwenhoekiella nanhaiensis TaxID=1655491 RepID=A0A2G1VX83_9FLAO|nr:DUF5723 family protein [Leeuwenhoekiella nanhaiensis]PHQ31039.1 hypothetical protein CJ305_02095 [Leeuwenhoekiella nanhaiensis]
MKQKLLFLAIFSISLSINLRAQNYIGHRIDNYSGIHGVMYNPANVFDSRMRADINLVSAGVSFGNDYAGISSSSLNADDDGFDFEEDADLNPTNSNNFYSNVDVMGPSFMFNLNPKSSIGLITRVRGIYNLHNVNGELFQRIADDFDSEEDFTFDLNNLNGTLHAYAEVGLVYGRVLMDKESHFLKGGATLKYLAGGGGAFFNSSNLTGQYSSTNANVTVNGNVNYGQTTDEEDFDFTDTSSGFGADFGVVYEWRPENANLGNRGLNKYKLKLGLSVTDLGSINYDESTIGKYSATNTVITEAEFNEKDIDEILQDNFDGQETVETSQISLPTALHIAADYHLKNKFYLNLQTSLSLVSPESQQASRIANIATLSPRFESKWFSAYMPLSMRQYDGFAWGFGLRAGPLTLGSSTILTNLISESSKGADVYIGLKVPIYQRSR